MHSSGSGDPRRAPPEAAAGPGDPRPALPVDLLEPLKPYPKLSGLSLAMNETRLLEVVNEQGLKTRRTQDGGNVRYEIGTDDGHLVVVTFAQDGEKCSGIQRVRGELKGAEPSSPKKPLDSGQAGSPSPGDRAEPSSKRSLLDWSLVYVAEGARGDAVPSLPRRIRRVGDPRFKAAVASRQLAFAGDDDWLWLKTDERLAIVHRETGHVIRSLHGVELVRSIVASADGSRIAIAGSILQPGLERKTANQITVWSARTAEKIASLPMEASNSCLGFSADGRTLLTGTQEGDVRLLEIETGKVLRQRSFEKCELWDAAISPDGQAVVLGGLQKSFFWKFDAQTEPVRLAVDRCSSVCFAPNGKLFATANEEGARLWDATAGKLIAHLKPSQNATPGGGIAFTSDSRFLAVPTTHADAVELWDVESRQRVASLPVVGARCATISHNGRWLAATGSDARVLIFDLQTRKLANPPSAGHARPVRTLQFAPNGDLLTAGDDARLWDVVTGQQQRVFAHDKPTEMLGLAVSPDGKTLVTSARDETLGVWDRATGKRLLTLKGQTLGTHDVRFTSDGLRFVCWDRDAVLRTWNAKTGSLAIEHRLNLSRDLPANAPLSEADVSLPGTLNQDASRLLVRFKNDLLEFDTQTGKRLRQVPSTLEPESLALSPDGRWLAGVEVQRDQEKRVVGNHVLLLDLETWQTVRTWVVEDPFHSDRPPPSLPTYDNSFKPASQVRAPIIVSRATRLKFSPDSKRIAWSRTGVVNAVDIVAISNESALQMRSLRSPCLYFEFSPDGRQLATAHDDTTVSLWDVKRIDYQSRATEVRQPGQPRRELLPSVIGEIVGRVVAGNTGRSIAGVKVACANTIDPLRNPYQPRDVFGVTDADGRYRLPVTSAGLYDVWLVSHSDPAITAVVDDGIWIEEGKVASSELRLLLGCKIVGKVIDELLKETRVGVDSPALLASGSGPRSIPLRKDGTFEVVLPPGRAYFTAATRRDTKGIHIDSLHDSEIWKREAFVVNVPEQGELAINVFGRTDNATMLGRSPWWKTSSPGTQVVGREEGSKNSGTVVDVSGKPVAGAKVFGPAGIAIETDAAGKFQFTTEASYSGMPLRVFATDYHVWFGVPSSGDILKIVLETKGTPRGTTPTH